MSELILFVASISAGFLGAILGIGGGLIIVPVLTLYFNVNIKYAIAASLISIIATSSGAAASFLKDHFTNIRVAVFLEMGTVFGALSGFVLATYLNATFLYIGFGSFLLLSALMMLRVRHSLLPISDDSLSKKLKFASYYPSSDGLPISYSVENSYIGLGLMYIAGILSAILGIGSGILKVIAMDRAMKLPLKVSTATSNFMIGVTAAASAGAYFIHGDIRPIIAAPVCVGILVGSFLGARMMVKMNPAIIRKIFVVLLAVVAFQMFKKGLTQ